MVGACTNSSRKRDLLCFDAVTPSPMTDTDSKDSPVSPETITILVAEDDREMRTTLEVNLEEAGYRVVACESGAEAIDYIQKNPLEIVITDLRLPDADGFQILEVLKRSSPDAALVLITGYGTLETAVKALHEGAFAYVTKPYSMDEVHSIIDSALWQRQLLLENRRLLDELQRSNKGLSDEVVVRKRAEEALERLRRQNELILNSAADGICGLDRNGNTTFVNPAAARMIGWEVEELIGQPQHLVVHHSKSDGSPYPEEECPTFTSLRDGIARQVNDEVFWKKNRTSFPVEYTTTPVRDEQGELVGVVVTFQDITERRRVERMKDEFVSIVSHELRTPLTSIKGYVDLIREGEVGDITEMQQSFLDIVTSNTDRLVALINDLLDISRIESGRVELSVEDIGLKETIETVRSQMRTLGDSRRAHTVVDVPEEPIIVSADRDRIIQVLTNLLSNAYKYSPEDSTVTIRAAVEGDFARVEITDQGIGIPEEDQTQLFTKFFRVDSAMSRGVGGTGLGLSIVKSLVELHGGQTRVKSREGDGSTFSFTLPVAGTGPIDSEAPVAAG